MKKIFAVLLASLAVLTAGAQALPTKFEVKIKAKDHVQGMAIDTAARCFYLSFTTSLVKTDYEGNVLASIDSIFGHLGAMTFDAASRKLYASLECKDDVIGQGIAKHLGKEAVSQDLSKFYIMVFDVDGGQARPGAANPVIAGQWEVSEAINDYKVRYGCSGIDGVTIAPQIGKKKGKPRLYVAYGIYGDISRRDNDHQILLEYKLDAFKPGVTAPKASAKYFVFTGNTTWGVQNLAYDASTGRIYMAVYKGKKPQYPNYPLFSLDVRQKPVKACPPGLDEKHETLKLSAAGLLDEATGVRGWDFKWGSTGLCPLGDGLWYISENHKDKATGIQSCTARLYRWTGDGAKPFTAR